MTVKDQAGHGTIGETIEHMLQRSTKLKRPMPYSRILERVRRDHPEARTTKACVDYYAWNLRRQGLNPNVRRSD